MISIIIIIIIIKEVILLNSLFDYEMLYIMRCYLIAKFSFPYLSNILQFNSKFFYFSFNYIHYLNSNNE